jgi:CheY-like chemotaxis protein
MRDMNESGKTILLVEDEVLIAMMEQMILEKCGHRVIRASTGERAVAIAEASGDIDLVLMDINLGAGIDGTEAATRILGMREIPLVFLSSHTEHDVVERTEGISSYGYILKNAGETVLVASIKMAFKLFEARKEEKAKTEALIRKMDELERFHRLTVDRELAMMALKREINELLRQTGRAERYRVEDAPG